MRLFLDIARQTLQTLWSHKLRSFLTMFGIAWGVGSLLLLVGLGEGFRKGNRRQLERIGPDIMFNFGGRIPAVEGSAAAMRPFTLTFSDYLSVKGEARALRSIAPVIQRGDIRAQTVHTSASGQVLGVLKEFGAIRVLNVAIGRWINDLDLEDSRRVVVINDEMRRNMFPDSSGLGGTVLLNGMSFVVVGVLEPPENQGSQNQPIQIYMPFTTMRDNFPLKADNGGNLISFMVYQPLTREMHEEAQTEVRRIIARNHGGFDHTNEDAWFDWDTVQSQEMVGKIFTAMNLFLGGVGIVTLSLGAIGIINIMLVSVTERISEIGLRKALGATNGTILTQFFLEGAFLTVVSGFVGLAFAGGLMRALDMLPSPPGFDTPQIVPWSAALAIGLLSLCGVVAGLYPARKAALLTPVEALRKD
jgi:putative ABC transport system permease protein